MMSFIVILDSALAIVLLGFNAWNWFLAMTGLSTIEFWGVATRVSFASSLYLARSLEVRLPLQEYPWQPLQDLRYLFIHLDAVSIIAQHPFHGDRVELPDEGSRL